MLLQSLRENDGISLLEALAAAAIVAVAFVLIGVSLPKTIQAHERNRFGAEATRLASSNVQKAQDAVYQYMALTPSTMFTNTSDPGCDCLTDLNVSLMTPKIVETPSMRYRVYQCVSLVSRPATKWVAHCPGTPDTGYKLITARVQWDYMGASNEVKSEALVAR